MCAPVVFTASTRVTPRRWTARHSACTDSRAEEGSIFNDDFQDFIRALNVAGVRYMLLCGYAVVLYGYDRTTGVMDAWEDRTPENYRRLVAAFATFGTPTFDMTERRFLDPGTADVFSFGVPPTSIDLLTAPAGISFADCFARAQWIEHDGLSLRLIAREDLLIAKRAAGRARDLDDIAKLSHEDSSP